MYFSLESEFVEIRVDFATLKSRLVNHINKRINNGEFTERGLARLLGISQPQVHNVLKGARKLSCEVGDRILVKLDVSLLDLIADQPRTEN